jgi:hypothetical protein
MGQAYTFKFRRDEAADWVVANPVLADGEPGVERDTGKLKIGDGVTSWIDLPYFVPFEAVWAATFPEHVNSELPHPVYDDGASFTLLYENAKV